MLHVLMATVSGGGVATLLVGPVSPVELPLLVFSDMPTTVGGRGAHVVVED